MASQQQSRIQSYLEKNKIGPLFEVSALIISTSVFHLCMALNGTRMFGCKPAIYQHHKAMLGFNVET